MDVRRCALCSHTSLGLRAVALTCTCACTCACTCVPDMDMDRCARLPKPESAPFTLPATTLPLLFAPSASPEWLHLTHFTDRITSHRRHGARCSTGPSWTHDMTICTCTVCSISLMYISTGTSCTCCCSLKLSALTTRRAMLRQLYLPAPSCGSERDWKNRSASLDGPFDEYRS